MSLNFFKQKTAKTDASLNFNTVVNDINTLDVTNGVLNIDTFIQSESVNLQRHQGLFTEEKEESDRIVPEKLEKDGEYTAKDIRLFAQTLSKVSKSMPEVKGTTIDHKKKVESLISINNQTINDVKAMEKGFI